MTAVVEPAAGPEPRPLKGLARTAARRMVEDKSVSATLCAHHGIELW